MNCSCREAQGNFLRCREQFHVCDCGWDYATVIHFFKCIKLYTCNWRVLTLINYLDKAALFLKASGPGE